MTSNASQKKATRSRAVCLRGPVAGGIIEVVPEPSNQIADRQRRGSHCGRPPGFDAEDYKARKVRNCNMSNNGADGPPAMTVDVHLIPRGCAQVIPQAVGPG
jgi:hypothetical protein